MAIRPYISSSFAMCIRYFYCIMCGTYKAHRRKKHTAPWRILTKPVPGDKTMILSG